MIQDILNERLKENNKEVCVENIHLLSKEEFAKIRMNGFGGSDSSKLLDCNPFSSASDLIDEKIDFSFNTGISNKPAVRKGSDLEPIILNKAEILLKEMNSDIKIFKPDVMYKDNNSKLTMNFDGVLVDNSAFIAPVEAKLVTRFGKKHYDLTKSTYATEFGEFSTYNEPTEPKESLDIYTKADHYGIPIYYYTQLQQEIYFLNSEYGYLAVLDDENWELYLFKVFRDNTVINNLIDTSKKRWALVDVKRELRKKRGKE